MQLLFPLLLPCPPALPASCFSFRTLSCPVLWQSLTTGSPWRSPLGATGTGSLIQFRHQAGWWLGPLLAVLLVDVMVTSGGSRNTRALMLGCPVSTVLLRAPPSKGTTTTCRSSGGGGAQHTGGEEEELDRDGPLGTVGPRHPAMVASPGSVCAVGLCGTGGGGCSTF